MPFHNGKSVLRSRIRTLRRQFSLQEQASEEIARRLESLPQWAGAGTVLFYVDCQSEVRTRNLLKKSLSDGRRCVVPFCLADELKLIHLQDWDELRPGAYGILEPDKRLRSLPDRQISPDQIDLALIPGVAFDRSGSRLGQGQGYYDRLLQSLPRTTPRIGLAFECQIVSAVPMEEHDQQMTLIVTESGIITPIAPVE